MPNDRAERLPFEILDLVAGVRELRRELAGEVAARRLDGTRHAALVAALGELETAAEALGRAARHVQRAFEPRIAAASKERRRRALRGGWNVDGT